MNIAFCGENGLELNLVQIANTVTKLWGSGFLNTSYGQRPFHYGTVHAFYDHVLSEFIQIKIRFSPRRRTSCYVLITGCCFHRNANQKVSGEYSWPSYHVEACVVQFIVYSNLYLRRRSTCKLEHNKIPPLH